METNVNIINFVLTFKWFDKIKSGEKTHEYRSVEKWEKRIKQKIAQFEYEKKTLWLLLSRGYTKTYLLYAVRHVSCNHGTMTDLGTNELVYDFELGELIGSN
ncbi:MAG: hypothetical protein JXR68_11405 [Bacteroidales bacterium]|nr:hypothetical protein [Bacteroidales bacterium]